MVIIVIGISVVLFMALLVFMFRRPKQSYYKKKAQTMRATRHTEGAQASPRAAVRSMSTASMFEDITEDEFEDVERKLPEDLEDFTLISENELSDELKEKISTLTKGIPRPRSILVPLTRGINNPKELSELVKQDPEIAAKVLRTVNSSFYNLAKEITSIHHAVNFMGITLVKNVALQIITQTAVNTDNPTLNAAYRKLSVAGLVGSVFGLRLGQMLNYEHASSLSTKILLSSIGNLIILYYQPELAQLYLEDSSLFVRTRAEQENLGANAAVMGSILARYWELPDSLSTSIGHSLLPMATSPTEHGLSDEVLQEVVLCYLSNRFGDLVAFHGLSEIGSVNILMQPDLEYFYLPGYVKAAHLGEVQKAMMDVSFQTGMNTVISQIAGR